MSQRFVPFVLVLVLRPSSSSFVLRPRPRPSSFVLVLRPSSFVPRPSSFVLVLRPSSFVPRPRPSSLVLEPTKQESEDEGRRRGREKQTDGLFRHQFPGPIHRFSPS